MMDSTAEGTARTEETPAFVQDQEEPKQPEKLETLGITDLVTSGTAGIHLPQNRVSTKEPEKLGTLGIADLVTSGIADIHLPQNGVSAKALTAADFASTMNAHNTLLESYHALSTAVHSLREEQTRVVAAIKTTDLEREKQIIILQDGLRNESKLLKEKRDNEEKEFREFKTSLEEMSRKHRDDAEKSIRRLDETLTPQYKALDRTMEDLVQKQVEIVVHTLPKWQAELSRDVHKVETDLSRFQETTSAAFDKLEMKLTGEQEARELAAETRIEWMASELNDLKSSAFQAEVQATSIEKALQQSRIELNAVVVALSDQTKEQSEKLEALLVKDVASAKEMVLADLTPRIKDVEDALKQSIFDGLRRHELLQQEIAGKGKELSVASQTSFQIADAVRSKIMEDVEEIKLQLKAKALSTQVEQNCDRLSGLVDMATSLQSKLTSLDDRFESSTAALQVKLQNQDIAFAHTAKQLESSADKTRFENVTRISTLEASSGKSDDAHRQLAEIVKAELDELRSAVTAAQAAIGGQQKATSAICARMDPMSEAVSDVVRDLGEFNKTQEQTGGTVHQIQTNIEDISLKMVSMSDSQRTIRELQWYIEKTLSFAGTSGNCLSCGKNGSPSGHVKDSLNNFSPNSSVGWSVKQPNTARPSSASRSRRRGESVERSSVQLVPPVGTGLFAARFQRTSPSTASTTATSVA